MIFRAPLLGKVLGGKKTQTRRPVKPGETECRYRPGRTYAVQPARGACSVGRITITAVRREQLREITYPDALAEGFRTREEFFDYWRGLYRTGPLMDVEVWVITFELDREHHPRLLAARSQHGYTDNPRLALAEEPEAVDARTIDRYAQEAQRRDADRERNRRELWEARALWQRVRELEESGEDVSRQLEAIRRRVEAAERKRKRAA